MYIKLYTGMGGCACARDLGDGGPSGGFLFLFSFLFYLFGPGVSNIIYISLLTNQSIWQNSEIVQRIYSVKASEDNLSLIRLC